MFSISLYLLIKQHIIVIEAKNLMVKRLPLSNSSTDNSPDKGPQAPRPVLSVEIFGRPFVEAKYIYT